MLGVYFYTMKKRILFCGESSHINSGFGNYTREILSRLYQYKDYEIAELSCYRTLTTKKTEPWKIYPVTVDHTYSNKELYKQYLSNNSNAFGHWIFDYALLDFKPDIVIDIRDFWNMFYQEISPLRHYFKWIICPTYDSTPQKISTMNMFKNADNLMFHTNWAKQDVENSIIKLKNIGDIASDSVDSSIFKPLNNPRNSLFGNKFVIGSVMRNQKRKLIYDLLFTISKLKQNNKPIVLYLHTSFPDQSSWNIPSILLELNIQDIVYFTYKCSKCQYYFPSLFHGMSTICHHCGSECSMTNPNNGINQIELNEIYNMFDLYIQYATCEGFGIPQVEAASAGVPVVSIDHGAMSEVCNLLGGHTVNVSTSFRDHEIEADRVYPDNNDTINIISKYIDLFYNNNDEYQKIKNNTRNNLILNFSWDKTCDILKQAIDSIDISSSKSWDSDKVVFDYNNVPEIKNNRDFIYHIVDNIIKDRNLKYTNYIQEMILNLDNGKLISNNLFMIYNRQVAIADLQKYLNHKMILEKIRSKELPMPEFIIPFLNY